LSQLEQAFERCERLALASQFASVIMHEVNNYLESITNLVYLTKLQTNVPNQVMGNMESIEQQLTMLANVTRRSLAFHRSQNEIRDVELSEIVQSALKLHSDAIAKHGVEVEIHFARSAQAPVREGEILQVISNLLLNALDAIPSEGGKLAVQVAREYPFVKIVISDNGHGIPDELAEKLFEPYVTSKPTGTGLGLWLSKRIVERHKGVLQFTTARAKEGSGTSFSISLPASLAA
jgi:signal transduction histidine kinase